MGNLFSSSSGRKLSPFSQKMAEGVFPEKVVPLPRCSRAPALLPRRSHAAPTPLPRRLLPASRRATRTAALPAHKFHAGRSLPIAQLISCSRAAGRRAVRCDLDGDVL